MGVVRSIDIEVPFLQEHFDKKLRRFIDFTNARYRSENLKDDITLSVSDDVQYEIWFGNGYYDSFLFLLFRLVKTYYQSDVTVIFDGDGDDMDERMVINYVDGKFTVDFAEVDWYQMEF
jgi:hypothetical protein